MKNDFQKALDCGTVTHFNRTTRTRAQMHAKNKLKTQKTTRLCLQK